MFDKISNRKVKKKSSQLKLLEESEYLISELVKELKNCLQLQEIEKNKRLMNVSPPRISAYNGTGSLSGGCTACRARLWAPHNGS